MLDHMTFRVADIGRTRSFDAAALAPLGYALKDDQNHDGVQVPGFGAGNNIEAVCHDAA